MIIGLGWTGSILANELTDEGLDVVAIEHGPRAMRRRSPRPPYDQDELRYAHPGITNYTSGAARFTFRNKMKLAGAPNSQLRPSVRARMDRRRRRGGPLERGDMALPAV